MKRVTLLCTFVLIVVQSLGGLIAAPAYNIELSNNTTAAAPPVSTNSVSGVVKNGTTPVSGATVQLVLPYTDASHQYQAVTTTTNSSGAYSFSAATLSGYNTIQSIKLNSWQNSGTNYYPSNISNIPLTGSALTYNFNTQKSAPAISITSPAADVSTNTGGSIALSANVTLSLSDGFTTLNSVVFSVDGSVVSSSNTGSVYTGSWSVSPSDFDTSHTLSITAQSSNGESVTQNLSFTLHTNYDVTLSFKDADDVVIPNVLAKWKNSSGSVLSQLTANSSGEVVFQDVLPYKSYSFTYSLDGYNFLPSSYSLSSGTLNSDMTIDVLGSNEQLSISGTITENGSTLQNVVVSLRNASNQVLSVHNSVNGTFSFEGVIPGYEYNVTATKSYYTLSSINYPMLNASVNDALLTGTRNAYSVSGNITSYGNPLQGTTVTVSGNGQQYQDVTDGNGDYQIASIPAGYNYTVTPTQTGYIFMPTNGSITLLNTNKTFNFSEDTRKIYGVVKTGNTAVVGASVELVMQYQDEAHQYLKVNAITDANGAYSFDRNITDGYNQLHTLKLNSYENDGTNYYPSNLTNLSLTGGQLEYDFNTQTSIPTIGFTSPLISASASSGGSVPLAATVALNYNDGSSTLSSVAFAVDGATVSSTNSGSAYSGNWSVSASDFNAEHIFKVTAMSSSGYTVSDSIFFSLYEIGVGSDIFYISESGAVDGDATTEATAAIRISTILANVESGDEIRLLSGTIEETASVAIPAGVQVVLEDGVVMNMGTNDFDNMGTIVLETGANFVQGEGSALTGTGNFEIIRETTAGAAEYNYLSSPIVTSDIVNVFSGSYVVRYNPSTAVTLNDGWEFISSGQMELGRGYAISGKNDSSFSGRRYFNGKANNGNVSITIDGTSYGGEGDDWNMVGNPYPSSIDMQAFLAANNGIGAIYVYNQSTDSYQTHNVLSDPDGVNIASGQAFFINASAVNQVINFTNSMRVQENSNILRVASVDGTKIHLYKEGEEQFSTQIAFDSRATDAYDVKYDAPLLPGSSSAMIYTLQKDKPMAIQAFGKEKEDKSVALGLQYNTGKYTIKATGTEMPYLIDKALNVMHNFADGDYTFDSLEDGVNETRFELWYPKMESEEQVLLANFKDGYLQVRNYTDDMVKQVSIYDTMGKQITSWSKSSIPNQKEFELHINTLPSAIYIIELKTDSFSKVIKTSVVRN